MGRCSRQHSSGCVAKKVMSSISNLSVAVHRFVVRPCFGGYNEAFVLSGSEECKVRHLP